MDSCYRCVGVVSLQFWIAQEDIVLGSHALADTQDLDYGGHRTSTLWLEKQATKHPMACLPSHLGRLEGDMGWRRSGSLD